MGSEYNSGGGPLFPGSTFTGPVSFNGVQSPRRPWSVPRGVNSLFTGREDVLRILVDTFLTKKDEEDAAQIPRRFIISGLGGTGKSELCIKFATKYREKYWGVFWIDCKDSTSAGNSFGRIGRLCCVTEPSIDSVKDLLSSVPDRWLLIVDNADDVDFAYSTYFPSAGYGDIIVTTRNPHLCEKYATAGWANLEQLESSLAQELLLRSAGIAEVDWDDKRLAATEIIEELGRHTLAILHVGAYIAQQGRIEDYLELYRRRRDRLFKSKRKQEETTYDTVHATFEVSMKKIENIQASEDAQDQVAASDAIELITVLAFMHYEGSIEQIFRAALDYASVIEKQEDDDDTDLLKLSKAHTVHLPEYLSKGANDGRLGSRWRSACRMLINFSLISEGKQDGVSTISMHSLTHKWAKERLEFVYGRQPGFDAQQRAWLEASRILALSYSGARVYDPIYEMVKTHVHACLGHSIQLYSEQAEKDVLLAVIHQLAWVQFAMYDEFQVDQVLGILRVGVLGQTAIGEKSRDLAEAKVRILAGIWLRRRGDSSEAVVELQKVVQRYEVYFDEVHPARLAAQYYLAEAYKDNGQVERATILLEHIVSVEEKKLDEGDLSRLASQHTLAEAYKANGQVEKAVTLLKHVVSIKEKELDWGHPSRLASQHALAEAYKANRQVENAVTLLEHIVNVREKKLDKEHPDQLMSLHDLARAYKDNGQLEKAVILLEYVVSVRKKKSDEGHPERLASEYTLGCYYMAMQRYTDAIRLLEHVAESEVRTLPKSHSNYLMTLGALMRAYELAGQDDAATQVRLNLLSITGQEEQ